MASLLRITGNVSKLLLATICVLLTSSQAPCEQYRDPARHFSLELPDGWERMPTEMLAAANEPSGSLVTNHYARFVAGFRPKPNPEPSQAMILVSYERARVKDQSLLEQEQRFREVLQFAVKEQNDKLVDLSRQVSVGEVVLDRQRKRFVFKLRVKSGQFTVAGLAFGIIGRQEVVQLNCYCLESGIDHWLSTFSNVADSVRIDDVEEASDRTLGVTDWKAGIIGGVALFVVLAGVVALTRRLLACLSTPK